MAVAAIKKVIKACMVGSRGWRSQGHHLAGVIIIFIVIFCDNGIYLKKFESSVTDV